MTGLFGLGAGTPSRFPYTDRPQSGPGIGASSGQVIRARLIIITDANGGLFIYAGTPRLGNPPIIWVTEATTDPYGNTLPFLGVGVRNGGLLAGITSQASVVIGSVTEASLGLISDSGAGGTSVESSTFGAGDVLAGLLLLSKNVNGIGPRALIENAALLSTAGTAANPSVVTTDGFHSLAVVNGWASSSLKYQLTPDRKVHLIGLLDPAAASSTTFATLPAGYQPASTQDFPLGFHSAVLANVGVFGRVATGTGVLAALNSPTPSANGVIVVNTLLALDY